MNWLNIHTDTLRSQEFLGAEPIERATWLALLGWCATQENGGVISGALDWTDRRWQQTCGVTKSEAETASDLYGFDGGDLVVRFYPVEKQAEVVAKREAGKRGGRPRKPLQTQEEKPHGLPDGSGELILEGELSKSEAETEGKGREGKEKGIEDIVGSEDPLVLIWGRSPKKARERSSRKQLNDAWKKIKNKPTYQELEHAISAWEKSETWTKEDARAACGVHRWVNNEQWANLPEPKPTHSITSPKGFDWRNAMK